MSRTTVSTSSSTKVFTSTQTPKVVTDSITQESVSSCFISQRPGSICGKWLVTGSQRTCPDIEHGRRVVANRRKT